VFDRIISTIYQFVVRILIITGLVTGSVFEFSGDIIGETGNAANAVISGTGEYIQDKITHLAKNTNNPTYTKQKEYAGASYPKAAVTPANIHNDYKNGAVAVAASGMSHSPSDTKWCIIGDVKAQHGCIQMNKSDHCLSGRSYETYNHCMNASY